jgi:hypothetical protein
VSVQRLRRDVRPIVGFVLVAVAVLGYVAGHRGNTAGSAVSAPASGEASRLVSAGNVLLEVPSRWLRAPTTPAIPGLALEGELAIAPGDVESAGLVSGQLASGQAGPLPAAFVHSLSAVPRTDVLNFLGGQAYEYSGLSIPG